MFKQSRLIKKKVEISIPIFRMENINSLTLRILCPIEIANYDQLIMKCFVSCWKISHSNGDFTFRGEGQRIKASARHLWPLSTYRGFLSCHTF